MALSLKRRKFVEEYLRCWNASEAARQAGYTHADRQGSRLLSFVEVQDLIGKRIAEVAMSADEVLLRLAGQARGSMESFLTIGENGSVKIDLAKAQALGCLHLVKGLTEAEFGFKLDLYDAQSALVQLGKGHGLFTDRHEHSGPAGGPIEIIEVVGEDSAPAGAPSGAAVDEDSGS
jgi:phage terminase small subunit